MSANEQPSKELIVLESTKKIVEFNKTFEQLKDEVIEQLNSNKYNSVVTIDNFDVMKKTAQELGKIAEYVSRFRIDKVKEESAEIQDFEKNFKEITKIIEEKQETIKEGLSVFEELTRKQINLICKEYLTTQFQVLNIRLEFQNIDISDMTQRKFMTGTGAISAAGKAEIESRVNLKLALQNKVDLRLSNLENICFKAGIEPLTIEHIQGFLFEADDKYEIKLKLLIDAEVKRSEAVKARVEAETRKAVAEEKTPFDNVEEVAKEPVKEVAREVEQPIKKEVPVVADDGKILRTVSMQVTVKPTIPDELVLKHIFGLIENDVNKFIEMFKVS